ncbi:MAG: hypothetical protein LBU11_11300, partial [Zoogloeaceae bacterium]|nr:hypothetical protein [Zoogloeaceae bacterium]
VAQPPAVILGNPSHFLSSHFNAVQGCFITKIIPNEIGSKCNWHKAKTRFAPVQSAKKAKQSLAFFWGGNRAFPDRQAMLNLEKPATVYLLEIDLTLTSSTLDRAPCDSCRWVAVFVAFIPKKQALPILF